MIPREGDAGCKILVVDDEECIRYTFSDFLNDDGFETSTAGDYDAAMELLNEIDFDLVFVDIILGGRTGLDLVPKIKEVAPQTEVIVITGAPTERTALTALKLGALDFIAKPVRQDALLRVTARALEHKRMMAATEWRVC